MSTPSCDHSTGRSAGRSRAGAATGVVLAGIGDEAAPDLAGQLAAVGELGWNRLELRTIDGVPLARLDDASFRRSA